jgi:hypothetical protein
MGANDWFSSATLRYLQVAISGISNGGVLVRSVRAPPEELLKLQVILKT